MGPPSGGPAREAFYRREVLKGSRDGVLSRPSKGVVAFLGRAKFEEASANYLVRCAKPRNVAPLSKKYLCLRFSCGKAALAIAVKSPDIRSRAVFLSPQTADFAIFSLNSSTRRRWSSLLGSRLLRRFFLLHFRSL